MSIGKICEHHVVFASPDMPVHEAAKLMKKYNIGDIVVIAEKGSDAKPIGMLTDRDIAIKIVADDINAKAICIGDAMSGDVLMLKEHQGVQEAIDMMSAKGVRRAPVVNDQQKVVGIASIDDLLVMIADEMSSLAKLVRKQIQ